MVPNGNNANPSKEKRILNITAVYVHISEYFLSKLHKAIDTYLHSIYHYETVAMYSIVFLLFIFAG